MKERTLTSFNASCICTIHHSHCRRCNRIILIGQKLIRTDQSRPRVRKAIEANQFPYLCCECGKELEH